MEGQGYKQAYTAQASVRMGGCVINPTDLVSTAMWRVAGYRGNESFGTSMSGLND
jgi:hypothetical protein